jgi:hypothetical protein
MENLTTIYQVSLLDIERTSYPKSARPILAIANGTFPTQTVLATKQVSEHLKKMTTCRIISGYKEHIHSKQSIKKKSLKYSKLENTQYFQITSEKRKGKLRNTLF